MSFFYPEVKRVYSYLGWEQEYFLVDRGTLCGTSRFVLPTVHSWMKVPNQQLEDHYFGAIPPRVAAFMKRWNLAYKYAIPLKPDTTKWHPTSLKWHLFLRSQSGCRPKPADDVTDETHCAKHHFKLLLHENICGVNGSGNTTTGHWALIPIRSFYSEKCKRQSAVRHLLGQHIDGRLQAQCSSSIHYVGRQCTRLGANEAPPAIISVFLGKQISSVLDKIEQSSEDDDITVDELKKMKLGISHIPEVLIDNTDRNRTSPFAFTGNRFEFRAVGSSANCSSSLFAINAAVAAQLIDFKEEVEKKIANGMKKEQAIFDTLRIYIKESKPIRFEGNGYSEEWKKEANVVDSIVRPAYR